MILPFTVINIKWIMFIVSTWTPSTFHSSLRKNPTANQVGGEEQHLFDSFFKL